MYVREVCSLLLSDGSKLFSSDFDSKCKFDIHRFDQIKFLRKRIKSSFAQNFLNKNKIDIIFFDSWKSLELFNNTTDIKKICLVNYGVGFVTSSPMNVKGSEVHPIYAWIDEKYNEKPKWNFYKYLFDRNGQLVKSWSSMTKPNSSKITTQIELLI